LAIELIIGGLFALLLAALFRLDTVDLVLQLAQAPHAAGACLVSVPLWACAPPSGGAAPPPTLAFLDAALGFALLFAGIAIAVLSVAGNNPARASLPAALIDSLRWRVAAITHTAWVVCGYLLVLASYVGAWYAARSFQEQLRLQSRLSACGGQNCPPLGDGVSRLVGQYGQFVGALTALVGGVVAIAIAVAFFMPFAALSHRFEPMGAHLGPLQRRVWWFRDDLLVLGRITIYVFVTYWIVALLLSAFASTIGLSLAGSNPSRNRIPLPPGPLSLRWHTAQSRSSETNERTADGTGSSDRTRRSRLLQRSLGAPQGPLATGPGNCALASVGGSACPPDAPQKWLVGR
jgi:hypothetical protein